MTRRLRGRVWRLAVHFGSGDRQVKSGTEFRLNSRRAIGRSVCVLRFTGQPRLELRVCGLSMTVRPANVETTDGRLAALVSGH